MKDRPHILLDDCRGGYLITKHLIELGHREIVGVFKSDDTQGQQRHKGYVQALQEAGISYDPGSYGFIQRSVRVIRSGGNLESSAYNGYSSAGEVRRDDGGVAASPYT